MRSIFFGIKVPLVTAAACQAEQGVWEQSGIIIAEFAAQDVAKTERTDCGRLLGLLAVLDADFVRDAGVAERIVCPVAEDFALGGFF